MTKLIKYYGCTPITGNMTATAIRYSYILYIKKYTERMLNSSSIRTYVHVCGENRPEKGVLCWRNVELARKHSKPQTCIVSYYVFYYAQLQCSATRRAQCTQKCSKMHAVQFSACTPIIKLYTRTYACVYMYIRECAYIYEHTCVLIVHTFTPGTWIFPPFLSSCAHQVDSYGGGILLYRPLETWAVWREKSGHKPPEIVNFVL